MFFPPRSILLPRLLKFIEQSKTELVILLSIYSVMPTHGLNIYSVPWTIHLHCPAYLWTKHYSVPPIHGLNGYVVLPVECHFHWSSIHQFHRLSCLNNIWTECDGITGGLFKLGQSWLGFHKILRSICIMWPLLDLYATIIIQMELIYT